MTSMMKIFNESGKGYWMEGFGCIRTEGENRPSRPGHIVLGCDLYNGTITGNKACNMNANSNNIVIEDGTAFNLMSMHGHDVHVICFQQNQREEVRNMGEQAGAITAESGMQNANYLCYALDHVITTGGGCSAQGSCVYENLCPTEKAGGVHAVCYEVSNG